jgi:transglutaminase-like putative cysteine protease
VNRSIPQIPDTVIFGQVTQAEFESMPNPVEKGSGATVLCDIATARMVYNNGFKIEFTRHIRIKILKSSGYAQANIQIPFTNKNRILNLKAITHNIEDNQLVKVAIGQKQFYSEKVDPYHNMIRFTFPNVREGSVIEYSYSITNDEIWEYPGMRFQRNIPVRYFEYQASIPEFFRYTIFLNQSSIFQYQYDIQKGYYMGYPADIHIYKWSGSNLPPYEPEPLMPESEEYLAGVDFALASVQIPDGVSYVASPGYSKLAEELLDNSAVGQQLNNSLLFAGKVRKIVRPQDPPLDKMKAIYGYVQEHMNWNGYEQLWPSRSLSEAAQEGTGTSAEINLILLNMLRTAGMNADPVVLCTRDRGQINPQVALAGKLNYLVCYLNIQGKDYLLDASDKMLPAGMLPFKCLNGNGWILNKTQGRWIKLLHDEDFVTREYYDLMLNEQGELTGRAIVTFSGFDALNVRRLIQNEGETGFRENKMDLAGNLSVSNLKFLNTDSSHLPLQVTFNVTFRHILMNINEMVCFKPMISIFGDYLNPWIQEERMFPVDKGCPSTESLKCRIQLPRNYKPEELPKGIRISLPGDDATFIFNSKFTRDILEIDFDLTVSKSFFDTGEYPSFREFYSQVNRKCNEMILIGRVSN